MSGLTLQALARSLGGDIAGREVLAPGPGHSPGDRSLSVMLDDKAPDGFITHSFAGDDALDCRDHVRAKAGLPSWQPQGKSAGVIGDPVVAQYVYTGPQGGPLLRVTRRQSKRFYQEHWNGRAWITGGTTRDTLVPYQLPDLLEAVGRGATVYIVEGEKDADALRARGLAATTSPMGAGKWREQFAQWFRGASVIILPDNDDEGRRHAGQVKASLAEVATDVRVIELPDLPPKGDVSDYLKAGGDPDAISSMPSATRTAPDRNGLPLINLAAWQDKEPPWRQWMLKDWLPLHQTTLFTGAGGTGKSLLAQQLATSIALGLPFMGIPTDQAATLYVTCEDDAEELWRRQDAICDRLKIELADVIGRLHLASLFGQADNELATFDAQEIMATAPAWERLRHTVKTVRPRLIILDNLSHLYAGPENNKHCATAFCNLLNGLALEFDCAVVLVAHPNKAGDEYSGTVAWENAVRSRIYLSRKTEADGSVIDRDARVLTRSKANYASTGDSLEFRWRLWSFVRDDDLPAGEADTISAMVREGAADRRFMECLTKAAAERRATSPNRTASNYAPRLFAAMRTAQGMGERELEAAMGRLLDRGVILNGERVYQRDNRAWVTGLGPAPTLAPTPAPTLAQDRTEPPNAGGKDCTNLHALTPLDTTYLSGAASGLGAPADDTGSAKELTA